MKRVLILLALAVVVGLPFVFRPHQLAAGKADDTVIVITSHNEALRYELGLGFAQWYRARTGRTVAIDWRVIGGTSEITRYLGSAYEAAFQNYWTGTLGRPWNMAVQAAFQDPALVPPADATNDSPAMAARRAFLASQTGCGLDVFCGGGTYDYIQQAEAGHLVDSGIMRLHPEWFRDDVIPQSFTGVPYWDPHGLWVGNVLSNYGMIYNRDCLQRLGIAREPRAWDDLQDPRLLGEIALCDPTKSSSIASAFENVIQQQIHRRWDQLVRETGQDRKSVEAQAVGEGWVAGLRLLQRIGANARYFTDNSQKPPTDVIHGDSAVAMCIDFYGRGSFQADAMRTDGSPGRIAYYSPPDGTVLSPDPLGVLRGAPHFKVAQAFMEYALSMDAQKLWNFKVGVPGGPRKYTLRRLPIRRDFYTAGFDADRSDPGVDPYDVKTPLIYHPEWTGALLGEMAFVVRVMCQDTHPELVAAWREIIRAGMPPAAVAAMSDMSGITYPEMRSRIQPALNSKNKVDAVRLSRELADTFRRHYAAAAAIARASRAP